MIQLSNEQLDAINNIKEFVQNSEDIAFSLTGAAGTGKTLIMNTLVKELENKINIILCAPTHKAKLVLEKVTERPCSTLHSILALTPNLNIFKLDLNELIFKANTKKITIPNNGLVICDEASMINDSLFNVLIKRCTERHSKILFVSDSKQLRPVKEEHESLVYSVKNNYNLTKIFRQNEENAILSILEVLRCKPLNHFEEKIGKKGSLYCTTNLKEFVYNYIDNIKQAIQNSDILATKLTTFTNARVDSYNKVIKKILFPNGKEYNVSEFLMCCDNIECNSIPFYNSMDYIITKACETRLKLPHFYAEVAGWYLELYDSSIKSSVPVFILSKTNDKEIFDELAYVLEYLRVQAIKADRRNKAAKWKLYYDLLKSFATPIDLYLEGRLVKKKSFVEGYACTTHKLQGSTLDNIFIDMKDINNCSDIKIKQQLQYVALSRTRFNAYLLQ